MVTEAQKRHGITDEMDGLLRLKFRCPICKQPRTGFVLDENPSTGTIVGVKVAHHVMVLGDQIENTFLYYNKLPVSVECPFSGTKVLR